MGTEKIGNFLTTLRESRGYTQQEVAEYLNISNVTIKKREQCFALPETVLLPVLAEMYDISADELLSGKRIVKESDSQQQRVEKRKIRLLRTVETRFDTFYAFSIVAALIAYTNTNTSVFTQYSYILDILGILVLSIGLTYSTTPIKLYQEMFEAETLFLLKQNIYRKTFLFVTVFMFTVAPLFSFLAASLFSTLYLDFYLNDIVTVVLLLALWIIIQIRLHLYEKDGPLFSKATGAILGTVMLIMVVDMMLEMATHWNRYI